MMYKRRIALLILGILFILSLIKGELQQKKEKEEPAYTEQNIDESSEETEFVEGTEELTGEVKDDYALEDFSLFFEDQKLKNVFEKKGRLEYLQYSLYAYLYQEEEGDIQDATILKDFDESKNKVTFVVYLDQDKKYLNGTYYCKEDLFEFEEVDAEPGRTNQYQEEGKNE